ncbi:hypothetical protein KJ940_17270 [Myxococcota bacterium]|nr:hypothetical protein [Myxococcota bacterium]
MSLTLVPLPPNAIGTLPTSGFFAPPQLNNNAAPDRPPADWIPKSDGLRISSFPTPLAINEATQLALKNTLDNDPNIAQIATNHPLVEASKLLLQGLVCGKFTFRWIDIEGIKSDALKSAILSVRRGASVRVGLIFHGADLWGYIVDDIVPCLAGYKQDKLKLAQLRQIMADYGPRAARTKALLSVIRAALARSGDWEPSRHAWMRLFDLVLEGFADQATDTILDVRSLGPFEVEVGDKKERRVIYLLSDSDGFTTRLAHSLGCTARLPDEPKGRPNYLTFAFGQDNLAYFQKTSGQKTSAYLLGEGCAEWVADPIPRSAQRFDQISESVKNLFSGHIDQLKSDGQRLTQLVTSQPFALSDIGRALALYAPNVLGELTPMHWTPRFKDYMSKNNITLAPSEEVLDALQAKGWAFRLPPDGASDKPSLAFIEGGFPAASKEIVGDLSELGLTLWLIFEGARWIDGFGFIDQEGEPLFETDDEAFELLTLIEIEGWLKAHQDQEITHRLATLQRFIKSYSQPSSDLEQLCLLAAKAFAVRVLGDVEIVEALIAQGGGAILPRSNQAERVVIPGYGRFSPMRDIVHFNDN